MAYLLGVRMIFLDQRVSARAAADAAEAAAPAEAGKHPLQPPLWKPVAAHSGSLFADISQSHVITSLAVILATAVAVLGQLYRVKKRRVVEPNAMLMLLILGEALLLVYRLSS